MSLNERHRERGVLSPGLLDLTLPSLRVGAYSGTAGAFFAVGVSIFKNQNAVIFGLGGGLHWFAMGTSFWFFRSAMARAWTSDRDSHSGKMTMASAAAGSISGAMSGLLRGPRSILPWTAIGGGAGIVGQATANYLARRKKPEKAPPESWVLWLPLVKKLSNTEYFDMMAEKLLQVDAEIALIDEKIVELRMAEKGGDER